MRSEPAGGGRVDQAAGVVLAHLEQDPQLQLAERLAVEDALQVVERIAPRQQAHAQAGPFSQDVAKLLSGTGRLLFAHAAETEVVVFLTQIAKPLQVMDDQEPRAEHRSGWRSGGA